MINPCAIIPIYNHKETIEGVLASLEPLSLPCIIVDDGSDRATQQVLASVTARYPWTHLIRRAPNAGKGIALMTGFLERDSEFDTLCRGTEPLRVAAIVNWFGISDVVDSSRRPDGAARSWIGPGPGREELARTMSPITHVRTGVPPVLTIHGDADPSVPYAQSERLHEALDSAKVKNRLFTFSGPGHGAQSMTAEQLIAAYDAISSFLRECRVLR